MISFPFILERPARSVRGVASSIKGRAPVGESWPLCEMPGLCLRGSVSLWEALPVCYNVTYLHFLASMAPLHIKIAWSCHHLCYIKKNAFIKPYNLWNVFFFIILIYWWSSRELIKGRLNSLSKAWVIVLPDLHYLLYEDTARCALEMVKTRSSSQEN